MILTYECRAIRPNGAVSTWPYCKGTMIIVPSASGVRRYQCGTCARVVEEPVEPSGVTNA